jgi:putative oxidoreductase
MNTKSLRALFDRATVVVFDRLRDPSLAFVRVTWGWLFFQTGLGKLGNLGGTTEFFASLGLPAPGVHAVAIGALECVGGLLLLVGLTSRLAALLLVGNMAVAYVMAHRDAFGSLRDFTAAAPYPFLLASLLVLAFGPGRWSLDRLRQPVGDGVACGTGELRRQQA